VSTVREVLDAATAQLTGAGVESAAYDAAELLAFVLGTTRPRLPLVDEVDESERATFDALVTRRAAREPLQHLTGTAAFRHVELAVGPGVFVPRPETELLAGWAIETARVSQGPTDEGGSSTGGPVVVELCTGSGAIALSMATEVRGADVHAVELDAGAFAWAERNLAGSGVDLRLGDMADAFHDLDGTVDVVVCNPPYIPHEAWESVAPEARDHDPHVSLFATGDDGLDAIRVVEKVAARLLKIGGSVGVEHADVQGQSAPQVFAASARWADVRDHRDLAGRPRYLTARRA
jgi:release factor glutamine methyltransferase